MMRIAVDGELPRASDVELIGELIPLQDARLLELGCGAAASTRLLAERFPIREIVAMEVDRIQHEKNLLIRDLPKVRFVFGGAQAIDLSDGSVDAVIMLKSLHHVPVASMDQALGEIVRVVRPGGLVYISEPVYAGAFNAILRLFHDEKVVRQAAFDALCRTVSTGRLELEREIHFESVSRFSGFDDFERQILGATHSEFTVDAELHAEIKARFLSQADADGSAEFRNPMRVDLLRRPDSR